MRECEICGSLVDPDSGSDFCSLEPESWDEAALVRYDALRRRAGLSGRRPPTLGATHWSQAVPETRRAFYAFLLSRQPAERTVVSVDVAKVYGHRLDTSPDARVHLAVGWRTACGRRAGGGLHTQELDAVTCQACWRHGRDSSPSYSTERPRSQTKNPDPRTVQDWRAMAARLRP